MSFCHFVYVLFAFVVFSFLQYCAKRLAGKNVSEMTYFMSSGTQNPKSYQSKANCWFAYRRLITPARPPNSFRTIPECRGSVARARYLNTIQPVVKPVVQPVWQPVWQPAVSCKQTSNRLSNTLSNVVKRLDDNRVERTATVRSTVCQTKPGCTTGLTTGCIYYTACCQTGCQMGLTTGWMFVYTIQPVW